MSKKLAFLALVIWSAATTRSFAQPSSRAALNFQKIGFDLTTTMLSCPERIWPNYNWKSVNVLIGAEGQTPVIWRGQTGQVSPLPISQVPAGAFGGNYSFPSFEGRDAVAYYLNADNLKNVGDRADVESFRTIVHEGFHHFGQSGWSTAEASQRGTLYPISSTPRLYRRMMFDRMKEYFTSGGKSVSNLAKAAYWNKKWKSEFPDEYRASVDRPEGTAKYVDTVAGVIASGGCQMTEADVYAGILAALNNEMGYLVSATSLRLDNEAYDLGTLAALTLRFIHRDANWFQRVAKGDSPLDILLGSLTVSEDEIPNELKTQFQQSALLHNTTISGWLDNDLRLIKSADAIRVVPNDESFQSGSYNPKGFFHIASMSGVMAIPLAKGVEFHNHVWKMDVAADKVMFGLMKNPCAGHSALVVAKSNFTISDTRIDLHGGGVEGSMTGIKKTDANGLQWFCEEEKRD